MLFRFVKSLRPYEDYPKKYLVSKFAYGGNKMNCEKFKCSGRTSKFNYDYKKVPKYAMLETLM